MMLHTHSAMRGMVTAPHHLAAQSGLSVLREGGTAIEAMIAMAATAAVVYPHMNSIGGDGFWIIHEPGRPPVAIDGSGAAARDISATAIRAAGHDTMPDVGSLSGFTVAGTVSGWQSALEMNSSRWDGTMTLERLVEDAVHYARNGYSVSAGQQRTTKRLFHRLREAPGFAAHFLEGGQVPKAGAVHKHPALAETLEALARDGLDDFYRGQVARRIAGDLRAVGSPLQAEDLARHRSVRRRPLSLQVGPVTVFNTPPPTQGLAALMILGLVARLDPKQLDSFDHVHAIVEATKAVFKVRNAHIGDPLHMSVHAATYLVDHVLDRVAAEIPRREASPWPGKLGEGDTVYMAAADAKGRAVSFIQSVFTGFGSGVVLPETGILWHNRGSAFGLDERSVNYLGPGRKPRHTLAPALAKFRDGRVMSYGAMGGDGQPQTQAAVFTRYARFGMGLQEAVTAPRWVLGKSYGDSRPHDLKIENRFDHSVIQALQRAGHDVAIIGSYEDIVGHAAAIVRHADGLLEGAADPRSDGCVAAF